MIRILCYMKIFIAWFSLYGLILWFLFLLYGFLFKILYYQISHYQLLYYQIKSDTINLTRFLYQICLRSKSDENDYLYVLNT